MSVDAQGDFYAQGTPGSLSGNTKFEAGFDGIGELDLYLVNRDAPRYNLWGDEIGYEAQMVTLSREDALDFHAWLTEQLYGPDA